MNCEKAHHLIDAYLDSELDPSTSLDVTNHITECPSCRRLLESRQSLSKAIKLAAAFAPAPGSLRIQIRHKIGPRRYVRYSLATLGLAALVAACFGLAQWKRSRDLQHDQDRWINDVMTHYQASESSERIVDTRTQEPRSLQTWFASKVNWYPRIYKLFDSPFTLIGGRVDVVGSQAAPIIVYRSGNSNVDVFVTPSTELNLRNLDSKGLHVRSWRDSGYDYWAVSNGATADVNIVQSKLKVCQ